MKTIVSIHEANEILHQYKGGDVYIYMFSLSLRRLCVRVESPKFTDSVYIVLAGCKFIKGSFGWSSADVSIEVESVNESEITTRIVDKIADFLLVGDGGFALVQGSPNEFGDSFSTFLSGR